METVQQNGRFTLFSSILYSLWAQVVAHERPASPALLIKRFSKIRWADL